MLLFCLLRLEETLELLLVYVVLLLTAEREFVLLDNSVKRERDVLTLAFLKYSFCDCT